MRKRQHTRARRLVATAIAAAGLLTVAAAPAEAAVPSVARAWSNLMFSSLTVTATGAELRRTLTTQRATVTTRTAAVTKATAAADAAAKRVTAAAAADTAAKAAVTAARETVTTLRGKLAKVNPKDTAKIARGRKVVAGAEQTLVTRTAEAKDAATALTTARTAAATAGTARNGATAALTAAAAAVTATEQKIAALRTPAELAAEAAALSRDVVTQIRPVFTVADTTTVYGTTVHRNVAYPYKRMVDAAKAAGISISGGGFRTRQRQIELRKINGCPDVWTAPASSCRVPTAIPGRSLHEIGLAVDVTSGGRSLSSGSAAFKWLKVHADEYGFVNLPSEPWHWSITGG